MMSRCIALGWFACAMLATAAFGADPEPAAPAETAAAPVAESEAPAAEAEAPKGLKDVFAGKFLMGTAGDIPQRYSAAELANIKANYDIVTPENCMKPQPTHPTEDRYNFSTPDALVQWCQENDVKVWGHTLLWHSQTGQWFFQPGADGQAATRELMLERLKKHIDTVVGRYKGKILGWDVVNEAINDGGAGRNENLRNSSWYRAVGPDVLTIAFKYAHEADPEAELYYNDYNIEQGAARNTGKHASSMMLLKRLIEEGAPITGVGIQGHWHPDTNMEDIDKAIENYASLGLKVSITELDITAAGGNSGAFNAGRGGGGGGNTAEAFQKQAEKYKALFEILLKHADSIERVTFWGISDTRSWRRGQNPLLFDGQMQPKPAYQALIDLGLGKTSATEATE